MCGPSLGICAIIVYNHCERGVFTFPCFFFFSSRRRHTRFDCDWSSDVCSSDLPARAGRVGEELRADRGQQHVFVPHPRSEEHTSELQSQSNLVCRLLLEKKHPRHECYFSTLSLDANDNLTLEQPNDYSPPTATP